MKGQMELVQVSEGFKGSTIQQADERAKQEHAQGNRIRPTRKYDPDIYEAGKSFCVAFRRGVFETTGLSVARDLFGRDLKLSLAMVREYPADLLAVMSQRYFQWRQREGLFCSMPNFYAGRELAAHYGIKAMEAQST